MGAIRAEMGDILEGGMDLTVLPCSAKGSVSSLTQRWLDVFGIKTPRQMGLALAHGSISDVFPFPGPRNLTRHYVFAASVLNGVSSRAVIESIGRELGALTRADQGIKNIETPLLGAGAGKLEPAVSGAALYSGFVEASTPEARLFVFVNDHSRKQLLEKLFGELAGAARAGEALDVALTTEQVRCFHEALLDAFDRSSLKQVVYFVAGQSYATLVAQGNFREEVWELVMWAQRSNQVKALLAEALSQNPGNAKLRSFAASLS